MKKLLSILIFISISSFSRTQIHSPSDKIILNFSLTNNGQPQYEVIYKNQEVIKKSKLGIYLKNDKSLTKGFSILSVKKLKFNETWKPILGEQSEIRNNYNQIIYHLIQKETGRKLDIDFKIFDEGVAFRYEFPINNKIKYFIISDENTEFCLAGNHKVFWIPGDFDSQEYVYNITKLSQIDNSKIKLNDGFSLDTKDSRYRVQTPLMMKSDKGLYINIFEAAVINYPAMQLDVDVLKLKLKSHLVPDAIGNKAYLRIPTSTPWRTIMISDDARDIVSSKMILNLNEPCKLTNTDWIKPMKFIGIWWEMHVGKSTWNYAENQNTQNEEYGKLIPSGKHGATTENVKKYIDFASKNGIDAVLVEGWNVGWEDWFGNWKEDVFDFTTPYPDFNIKEANDYAKLKGVKMIMHNETSGSVSNYERHLDRALELMKGYDYVAVKTGYVGRIIPRGEHHYSQSIINHFNYVAQRAADYKIMVDSHESSIPTGFSRTYPNYLAAEAARGNEYNAWSSGNPPNHETILPFTRLLGGPMDYTPGIFEIRMNVYNPDKKEQVHTTLAKQLALYVTLYSPIQMAADLPKNYEKYPDAFQFIKDVPVDWSKSIYLEAEPGEYITVVRKDKNSKSWFLGSITNEKSRKTVIKFDFLSPNKKYLATIYQDGEKADWKNNPICYKIEKEVVTSKTQIKLILAPGGGTAISLIPIK